MHILPKRREKNLRYGEGDTKRITAGIELMKNVGKRDCDYFRFWSNTVSAAKKPFACCAIDSKCKNREVAVLRSPFEV